MCRTKLQIALAALKITLVKIRCIRRIISFRKIFSDVGWASCLLSAIRQISSMLVSSEARPTSAGNWPCIAGEESFDWMVAQQQDI